LTGFSYVSAFNGDTHAQTNQRPHARPAIQTLERLHAELGGKILENRQQAENLGQQMMHVEAVIKMLDPAYNLARITVKRRQANRPTAGSSAARYTGKRAGRAQDG
jgi:hypothetical protein